MFVFSFSDALIEEINNDIEIAKQNLDRAENQGFKQHEYFQSWCMLLRC